MTLLSIDGWKSMSNSSSVFLTGKPASFVRVSIADDLLDFTASEEVLGKPVLQDLKEGHITLPIIYALKAEPGATATIEGIVRRKSIDDADRKAILDLVHRHRVLDQSWEVAERYSRQARLSIEPLPASTHRESLLALADYVVDRNR